MVKSNGGLMIPGLWNIQNSLQPTDSENVNTDKWFNSI